MASSIPTQARAVDPFSSYHSNTVNRLTRMLTEGNDVLLSKSSLEIVPDSTSPVDHCLISPGVVFKDDVMINVSEEFRVDFTDSDHYASFGAGFNESGYYYICLEYSYVKSKPAPTAKIKIIKPSQKSTIYALTGAYVFLKAVSVIDVGPIKGIDVAAPLYDYDPEDVTVKREYVKFYAGGEVYLPDFVPTRDTSRMIYVTSEDAFYYGFVTGWIRLLVDQSGGGGGTTAFGIDTTGLEVGDICFIDDAGLATLAIASAMNSAADFVVSEVGGRDGGQGIIAGYVTSAKVQTGLIINPGDHVYLSETEAGTLTNVRTSPIYQMLGRAVTGGNSTLPITMIFSPKLPLEEVAVPPGSVTGQITSWTLDGATGLYYANVDISVLGITSSVISSWYNNATSMEITPAEVEIRASGDTLRVHMANNTTVVNYLISSGGAGGAGGGDDGGGSSVPGTTDHSLLYNLAYLQSGHTGFSPSPHGAADHSQSLALNPHSNTSHSVNYIQASEVTYTALVNTSSVGTGATQVARGNHTHPEYTDIPANEIILFEKNTAVIGYSLLTDISDHVIYATGGSGVGQAPGASVKGSWASGSHTHTTGTHGHTASGSGTVNTYHRHLIGNSISGGGFYRADGGVDGLQAHESDYQGSAAAAATVSVTVNAAAALTAAANATDPGWRPTGINYTRQRRI